MISIRAFLLLAIISVVVVLAINWQITSIREESNVLSLQNRLELFNEYCADSIKKEFIKNAHKTFNVNDAVLRIKHRNNYCYGILAPTKSYLYPVY